MQTNRPVLPSRRSPVDGQKQFRLVLPVAVILCSVTPVSTRPARAEPSHPPHNPPGTESSVVASATTEESADESADGQSDPSAGSLLQEVVARLPREPLTIAGDLKVRERKGLVVQELSFGMRLDWGSVPSTARYTIRDHFGTELEQLTVIRDGASLRVEYAAGSPPAAAAAPDLYASIQGTDLSWIDLTLSFLWWPDGLIVGQEQVKGRPCYVVEVRAPDAAAAERSAQTARRYAGARLWIDQDLRMLLQAEGYDADGVAVRRLWVKSFKKIDDRWMIKDMEIQSYPAAHRTKLRVDEVSPIKKP